MRRILALDLSLSSTGWAVVSECGSMSFSVEKPADIKLRPVVESYGCILPEGRAKNYGTYPWSYLAAADSMATKVLHLVVRINPEAVVIEETTKGRASASSQKLLEFLHCLLLQKLQPFGREVYYITTGEWRRAIGLQLTAEDRRRNRKVGEILRATDDPKARNQLKKSRGVGGKVTKKHLALRWVQEQFGINLPVKDDDAADAIALGTAYLRGAAPFDPNSRAMRKS